MSDATKLAVPKPEIFDPEFSAIMDWLEREFDEVFKRLDELETLIKRNGS